MIHRLFEDRMHTVTLKFNALDSAAHSLKVCTAASHSRIARPFFSHTR